LQGESLLLKSLFVYLSLSTIHKYKHMKKNIIYFFAIAFIYMPIIAAAQNVGIGTLNPIAKFHVADSNVLFGGPLFPPATAGNVPVSGAGVRMMWYPDKAAFRAGQVTTTQWNKDSIGVGSFATGVDPKALGFVSIAMGESARAASAHSIAMGNFAKATGVGATAIGVNANANGNFSTAIGSYNNTKNDFATAMGGYSTAAGYTSTAMGNFTTASGTNATSMGSNTVARSLSSMALGSYNDSISTSNQNTWVATDPLLMVGNGTSNATRNNALMLLKNGNLGLGTSEPKARLHVVDSNVVFTGSYPTLFFPGNPPISGQGSRMMWFANQQPPSKKVD
jgi:Head domain of trimeric autotransporter adhesin